MVMIFGIVIVVLAIWLLSTAVRSANGQRRSHDVHAAVIALGDVTQHSYDDIVVALGEPTSMSATAPDTRVFQWVQPRYMIGMSFDDSGRCLGIDHESRL